VILRTDKEFPAGIVNALQVVLLSQHLRVKEAYLVYLLANGPDSLDRYHMRLEVEGEEIHQLMTEMQPVLRTVMQRGEGFECWSKLGDDGIADYMRQQGNIYERV
jgi:hypothetical protein